jgi:TonB family protein
MALTGSLVGLLLYSVAVHSQQNNACGPIPPDKPATLCMSESPPVYPPRAKAAGIEGTVAIFAQINKSGRIDLAQAVSGPEPLRQAALNAVKVWVYRPYLFEGSPIGFRTVIKVKFTLEKPPTQPSPHN